MGEYNLLTQRLLAEGYTAENYPDYVRLPGGCWGKDLLRNIYGGFEYTYQYRSQMVFKTKCGLLVKGSSFIGSMSYMGILWIPENDNPVVNCPYRKDSCDLRNPVLGGAHGGGLSKIFQCDCHLTDEPYDYEKSMDKVRNDEAREKRKKYEAFAKSKNGHVCQWHAVYNDRTGKWSHDYDPMICSKRCLNVGEICDFTHLPVSKKKGNVFYDVKISYIRHDGTLFDGEKIVKINKGVRLFETGKSMTICEAAVRKCRQEIAGRERNEFHSEILLYGWKVEVLNIRAEHQESRDLMQDLEDIQNGIQIIHASDLDRKKKEEKKERAQQARQKKIERLEKKLLDIGYYNLEECSLDKIHADKWLGEKRIAELEELRKRRLKEEQEKPVQLSLFDMNW